MVNTYNLASTEIVAIVVNQECIRKSIHTIMPKKFGGELNLAVLRSTFATAKLKIHQYGDPISNLPNLNPPIFCNGDLGPNHRI